MSKQKYYYLIEFQYMGFRYHGWQKQPDVKTVQGMVDKTLAAILGHSDFNTLGASRTDGLVSANQSAFELFTDTPVDAAWLLQVMNLKLPNDIKALAVKEVDSSFNIIRDTKVKEYLYLFSYGEKNHPFCAPYMVYMHEELDIERMQAGARLFEGRHNFRSYCSKPAEDTQFEREILLSTIKENDIYTANFFPEKSFVYQVRGTAFMRHQVRLMMGALFSLGKGELSLDRISTSLDGLHPGPVSHMAPASGLILQHVSYR
jgi:tRNA pseudouridine38-40 synthase